MWLNMIIFRVNGSIKMTLNCQNWYKIVSLILSFTC